jgi:hypothetical protein
LLKVGFDTVNMLSGLAVTAGQINYATSYPASCAYAASASTLGGLDPLQYARRYAAIVSVVNSYVNIAKINGTGLASSVRLLVAGTGNSVVVNVISDILVNHFQDILVRSTSGEYTQLTIKITSDTNCSYNISIKTTSVNAANLYFTILADPINTVTLYTNNPALDYTTITHEHTTQSGSTNITATGGNAAAMYVENNVVWHGGNLKNGSTVASNDMVLTHGLSSGLYGQVSPQTSGIIAGCVVTQTGIQFSITNISGVSTSASVYWTVYGD